MAIGLRVQEGGHRRPVLHWLHACVSERGKSDPCGWKNWVAGPDPSPRRSRHALGDVFWFPFVDWGHSRGKGHAVGRIEETRRTGAMGVLLDNVRGGEVVTLFDRARLGH